MASAAAAADWELPPRRVIKRKNSGSLEDSTIVLDDSESESLLCLLCKTSHREHDSLLRDATGRLVAHYQCLLFSSGLSQSGKEEEGLKGFLLPDVDSELRRGAKLKCVHCKRKGATVGCARAQCKKSYHLPCGVKSKSLQQHYGQYKSFCASHRPSQKVSGVEKKPHRGQTHRECASCGEPCADAKPSYGTLWAPCCGAHLHRDCVQRAASAAGAPNFRCPSCGDAKRFPGEMRTCGVHVPDRDAAWDATGWTRPLMTRMRCHALVCVCDRNGGREHDSSDGSWELFPCNGCGLKAIHARCGGLDEYLDPDWYCYACRRVVRTGPKEEERRALKPLSLRWGRARKTKSGARPRTKSESLQVIFRKQQVNLPSSSSMGDPSPQPKSLPSEQCNITLESIIRYGLERKTAFRDYKPPAQQRLPEVSPGDSDYESGEREQGSPTGRKRKSSSGSDATAPKSPRKEVTFGETITNSIKNHFITESAKE